MNKMLVESQKIREIFDYLYNPTHPLERSDGAFVFCRDDPLVAERAAELYHSQLVGYVLFTGGLGKDSGYLGDLKVPEAKWQSLLLNIVHGVPQNHIYVEAEARNGAENSALGIDTIVHHELSHSHLTIIIHPTQMRRVHAVHLLKAAEKQFTAEYRRTGTNYIFDPTRPRDQMEAMTELVKIADWSEKGWCVEQPDVPLDLVEYAREMMIPISAGQSSRMVTK